ncbi:hypothetical protein NQZ68_005168 [Dissostichus eleginoides]|nr:hypothetical protein NQZ68_005168 [Dissostichus eleginoides]
MLEPEIRKRRGGAKVHHVLVLGYLLSGMRGRQADSPESRRQIPNTRHLTEVSEDVRTDT